MAERQPLTPDNALRRLATWGAGLRRGRSISVGSSELRIDQNLIEERLRHLGDDGERARRLDTAAERATRLTVSLSPLTSGLALDYVDRLAKPIPSLTPAAGVEIVTHAYSAHLAVERDPATFGAADVPVLGTLPPLKRGRPPQDILSRTVKASRRGFPMIRAVSATVWDGYVLLLAGRVHQATPVSEDLVATEVVDGLARFGWVLRQVDLHYNFSPDVGSDSN